MTNPSRSEVEAMAARAERGELRVLDCGTPSDVDLPRLAALAMGFGDAMEEALLKSTHTQYCGFWEAPPQSCTCWRSILRAALEGWRP